MNNQEAISNLLAWKYCKKHYGDKCPNEIDEDVFCEHFCWSIDSMNKAIDEAIAALEQQNAELQQYRQAKDEGRLVELPCKIGDTVYYLGQKSAEELEVKCVKSAVVKKAKYITIETKDIFGYKNVIQIGRKSFGKTVFPSHEAAEAALLTLQAENKGK